MNDCTKLLDLDDKNANYYFLRGLVLERTGDVCSLQATSL